MSSFGTRIHGRTGSRGRAGSRFRLRLAIFLTVAALVLGGAG